MVAVVKLCLMKCNRKQSKLHFNGSITQIGRHTFQAYHLESNHFLSNRSQISLAACLFPDHTPFQGLIFHCHSTRYTGMLALACSCVKQSSHVNIIGFNPHRPINSPNSATDFTTAISPSTGCHPAPYKPVTTTISNSDIELFIHDIISEEDISTSKDPFVIPPTASTSTGSQPFTFDSEDTSN